MELVHGRSRFRLRVVGALFGVSECLGLNGALGWAHRVMACVMEAAWHLRVSGSRVEDPKP